MNENVEPQAAATPGARRAPTRRPRRTAATLLAVVLAAVVGAGALVLLGQRHLIYHPDTSDPGPASSHSARASDVPLHTSDGLTLTAWRVDPEEPIEVAVLTLPGNGGNRLGRLGAASALAEGGFTVLMLEYRGYGGNPGRPSEAGLARDAEAAVAHLREQGFGPERTLYVGESIGAAVAVGLALEHPPAGLVLRSPFTSLGAAAREQVGVPVTFLLRDSYDTLSRLGSIGSPVIVLAGDADTIVPASQSAEVARVAPNLHRYEELPDVGHNDTVWSGPLLVEQVTDLARVAIGPDDAP